MPLKKEDEKKESDEEILRDVEREMAKPRIAKSPEELPPLTRFGSSINRNDRKAGTVKRNSMCSL